MITDVYTVSFADLKRTVGSKDHKVLAAILGECGAMLRDADGYLDKGAAVTCADALSDLIDGADFRQHPPPYVYRYRCALEAIWNYLGEYMGQLEVADCDELDEALAELDIPLKYSELVSGDEIVVLPAWNDVPCVGSWSPEQLTAGMQAFRRSGIEPLPWEEEGMFHKPEEVLGLLCGSVEEAARRPGWGLVAFSY